MTHKQVEDYLLSMPNARLDYPFGEGVAVYRISNKQQVTSNKSAGPDKMFAIIQEESDPLRISLKCDPRLAETLRARYETVMPGYHLNKKYWNTILLTGQLTWPEIQDLINHSYNLVVNS